MNGENGGSPYDSAIEDLKAKRDAIDSMITQLEQLKSLNVSSGVIGLPMPTAQTSTEIKEDSFFDLGIAEAAKKYLSMANRTTKTTHEIYNALIKGGARTNEKSLYVIISREAREGKGIVKVNKKWGLAEWYKTK